MTSAHLPSATAMCYHADMNRPMDNLRDAISVLGNHDGVMDDELYDMVFGFDASVNLLTYTMMESDLNGVCVGVMLYPERRE